MERYLKNLEAWCWRYLENDRNYPGLHFTAKPNACDAIIHCLAQLRSEGFGAHRTMPLKTLNPTDEAKISGGQRHVCFQRLRISLHADSEQLRQFAFRVLDGTVHFDLTERYASKFEQGIQDVRSGTGDYSICPQNSPREGRLLGERDRESEALWFWPCFGHLSVVP
jgi:hypothetical protein